VSSSEKKKQQFSKPVKTKRPRSSLKHERGEKRERDEGDDQSEKAEKSEELEEQHAEEKDEVVDVKKVVKLRRIEGGSDKKEASKKETSVPLMLSKVVKFWDHEGKKDPTPLDEADGPFSDAVEVASSLRNAFNILCNPGSFCDNDLPNKYNVDARNAHYNAVLEQIANALNKCSPYDLMKAGELLGL
jgi:hypothetical protein